MLDLMTIVTLIVATLLGAAGTLLVKQATMGMHFFQLWRSLKIWAGFLLYGLATLLYLLVLGREELSVVYPFVSLTYLWTTFLSVRYLGERMHIWKWLGLLGIIIGITLIGVGS